LQLLDGRLQITTEKIIWAQKFTFVSKFTPFRRRATVLFLCRIHLTPNYAFM